MLKRKLSYILFGFTLLGILGFTYISKNFPIPSCHELDFPDVYTVKYYTHPQKVVVEPWLGEHHAYAIFMIPGGYINDRLFKVTIPGAEPACGVLAYAGTKKSEGVYAQPGYYLMRALFNTRSAVRLIVQGKGDRLKQPDSWTVGYSKIKQH